jgi:hypothetical protein
MDRLPEGVQMNATGSESRAIVEPLGVFGPTREAPVMKAATLRQLRDGLDPGLRASVAAYLKSGAVILAFMEYTTDLLEGRFGVSGGSGVLSDGVYYWRRDAAEYVGEYGIMLPPPVLEHMVRQNWTVPALDDEHLKVIDRYLFAELSTH